MSPSGKNKRRSCFLCTGSPTAAEPPLRRHPAPSTVAGAAAGGTHLRELPPEAEALDHGLPRSSDKAVRSRARRAPGGGQLTRRIPGPPAAGTAGGHSPGDPRTLEPERLAGAQGRPEEGTGGRCRALPACRCGGRAPAPHPPRPGPTAPQRQPERAGPAPRAVGGTLPPAPTGQSRAPELWGRGLSLGRPGALCLLCPSVPARRAPPPQRAGAPGEGYPSRRAFSSRAAVPSSGQKGSPRHPPGSCSDTLAGGAPQDAGRSWLGPGLQS